ncbi:MAG: hypothetical protein IPN01_10925 [Deltaproteobacteria bacterium]|nr:hypothetical protein [Deltaproteobacteria bacterium]
MPADAPVLVIGPAVNEEDVEETPLGQPDGEGEEILGEDPGVDAGALNLPPAKDPPKIRPKTPRPSVAVSATASPPPQRL